MQTFNEWMELKEVKHSKPSIFRRTYYALPTTEQIEEFKDYPALTAEDINQGFGYTIVGRGISNTESINKIIESIQMLINRFPENKVYQTALRLAKQRKPYFDLVLPKTS